MLVNQYDLQHILQRETPKAITTTFIDKFMKGTQVIPVPNGNKVMDITMGNPQCDHLNTYDQYMVTLQRLNGCGREMFNQHQ